MSSNSFKKTLASLSIVGLLAVVGCSQQNKDGDAPAENSGSAQNKGESTGWFQQKKQNKDEAANSGSEQNKGSSQQKKDESANSGSEQNKGSSQQKKDEASGEEKKEERTGWFQQKKQNKDESANAGSDQNKGSDQKKDDANEGSDQKKDAPAPAPTPAPAPAPAPVPAPAPGPAPAPVKPVDGANLGTGVQAAAETRKVGESNEFAFIAKNLGNVELTNVVLVVDFGGNFDYIGTDYAGTATRDGNKVSFNLGNIPVDKSVTFRFTATCKAAGDQVVKTLTTSDQTTDVPNDEPVKVAQ